ncbi:hypothetical protein EVJ58_g6136 [Rhodofomes roseus]|uniref:Uncharacterized protein n=1 Tax=Rhodofomes roseus TaxID=34475 RepID=A0A4Y9YAF7_9APHY|nr:hypothetical protein EVJ58_g6136 [Rhodofomes roseus]
MDAALPLSTSHPQRHTTVEDIPDEDHAPVYPKARYRQDFPAEKHAAQSFGESPTWFEKIRSERIRDEQVLTGDQVYGPFEDEEEWELAKWLIKNVGHNQAENFLKLPIIRNRVHPTYHNKDRLLQNVDSLPKGVDWKCELVELTGDIKNLNGEAMKETVEFWHRDPLDCIRELIGNPFFRNLIRYAPEHHFLDKNGTTRVINEMWTADWWWDLQNLLPDGATIAPIILSSDKTKLSQFRGDKSAWPVYLTIGNIAKDVRREASSHATVLVGYLPVAKLDCFTDKSRPAAKYRLFHYCMRTMLASVAQAGRTGTKMTCADRQDRSVWPIVAAYVADYPEQCLVACCMENRCPMCQVPPDRRGDHDTHPARHKGESLSLIREQDNPTNGVFDAASESRFKDLGLRPVYPPFWADLPHSNVFEWFTPDLLHQLHKGVFKDHVVKWCTSIVGEDELDARFRAMSNITGLRHFAHGISTVSQWTGHEHKEMEKVFLGLLIGRADAQVIRAVRAVLDFINLAALHSHTTETLTLLRQSLDDFHTYKHIFIELGARTQSHFNIPKLHAIEHYALMILKFGSADGFNTESPERLHIDYAKDAYRASNHKDYTAQMVTWLRRQEAVDRFARYLTWCRDGSPSTLRPAGGLDVASERTRDGTGQDEDTIEVCPLVDSPEIALQVSESALNIAQARGTDRPQAQDRPAAVAPVTAASSTAMYKFPERHRKTSLKGVTAATIMEEHHAPQFLASLTAYLRSQGSDLDSSFTPQPFDGFDLYARLATRLPLIDATGPRALKNVVRASPPVPAQGRQPAKAAHLDFALVRTGEPNEKTRGTPLQGAYTDVL